MSKNSRRVWKVLAAESGTVQEILKKQAGFTKKEISRAKFLQDGIKKNGIRCRVTERTVPGDLLEIVLEEEAQCSGQLIEKKEVLSILYEDQDLLAVNKPAGLITHPQGGHYEDTLANQVMGYYAGNAESHVVRPIGRLDKDTSGIVVFAKNQIAAARLQRQREQGEFYKIYVAVTQIQKEKTEWNHEKFPGWDRIEERMRMESGKKESWNLLRFPMDQDPENRLRMVLAPDGKDARTRYQYVWRGRYHQIPILHLETGRTHQIRLHMASIGAPLLGDSLYGGEREQIQRAALHAWQVIFRHPYTGKYIRLTAPVPEDIRRMQLE